ncbi:MAG: endolytic transglycosylase MltG [Solirubrobacterales bacterium]
MADEIGGDSPEERERRRAERAARRRARTDQSRGAIGDRVKGVLDDDEPPARPPPPGAKAAAPRPPGGPADVRRRRLIAAVGALLAAVAIVVAIGALVHHLASSGGGGGGGETSTQAAKPASQVTIPEGYDRRQIAAVAKQEGISGDYMKASESAKGFNPDKYGAQNPSSLEGFLFPATYDMPRHPKADDLVVRQLAAFKQYIAEVNMSHAKSKNLTTYDVLTIASMIEREVQVPKERKLVAAVIYNRLHAGMPLQIDATIRFAENNYTKPLTTTDLQISSPYNTYTNSGLPPGPIGNPGLASIQAAAHPANVSYLYYVVKPNTCGELTFATTKAQFDRAEAAYSAAREANGGNAPTPANCPGA